MKNVILYGSRKLAKMIYYDAINHPDFNIVAFVLDKAYIGDDKTYLDCPLVAFEDVSAIYPPSEYEMIALEASYHLMRDRGNLFQKAKNEGYILTNYISHLAHVAPTVNMGENNIIFAFAHLGEGGVMGNCNTVREQVYIGHDFLIGHLNVFAPSSTIGGSSQIQNNNYIGLGSTILNDKSIGEECLIGGGAVVIKDIESYTKNVGNPSRVIGSHKEEGLKVNL